MFLRLVILNAVETNYNEFYLLKLLNRWEFCTIYFHHIHSFSNFQDPPFPDHPKTCPQNWFVLVTHSLICSLPLEYDFSAEATF